MASELLGIVGLLIVLLIIAVVWLFPAYMQYYGGSNE